MSGQARIEPIPLLWGVYLVIECPHDYRLDCRIVNAHHFGIPR